MSTRKIKNARDLESNELIYFKSHAQATFMSDGSTVEDVINEIKETGGADLTDYVTTTQLNTSLSGKQNTINDLDDIRSGASKGATAVQPASVATAVTINGVNKTISSNKINIGTIPTAVTINGSTKTGSTITLGMVVTGVTMNGSDKTVSNGKVDLGTIITAHQTLKTINGESIVGSGDIEISSGGSSDANVQAVDTGDVIDDVNVEYATKTYVDDKVANISLTDYATKAYVDELVGDINSVLESIINGSVTLITFTVDGVEYQAEEGMTWVEWVNTNYNTSGYYYDNYSNTIKMGNAHIINVSVDDLIINDASYTLYDPT